jgi:hypothetical protein
MFAIKKIAIFLMFSKFNNRQTITNSCNCSLTSLWLKEAVLFYWIGFFIHCWLRAHTPLMCRMQKRDSTVHLSHVQTVTYLKGILISRPKELEIFYFFFKNYLLCTSNFQPPPNTSTQVLWLLYENNFWLVQ